MHRVCLNPPKRDLLVVMLTEAVEESAKAKRKLVLDNLRGLRNLTELMGRYQRVPTRDWLLLCVAAVAPNHAIWQKGYRPPVTKPVNAKQQVLFDNSDDFWSVATEVSTSRPDARDQRDQ